VSGLGGKGPRGILRFGALTVPCALGRTGRTALKKEGDGGTPIGTWPVRRAFWRADRLMRPQTGLTLRAIGPSDGWCDAPEDRNYNRLVRHPYPASAEHMMRSDELYDVVVVLGHNERPRRRGGGSAIFMHVARPGLTPTAGCIALPRPVLVRLLRHLSRRTVVTVLA